MRFHALNTWRKPRSQILVLLLLFGGSLPNPRPAFEPTHIFAPVSTPAKSIFGPLCLYSPRGESSKYRRVISLLTLETSFEFYC